MTKHAVTIDAIIADDPKGSKEYLQKNHGLKMVDSLPKKHKYDNHDIEVLTSTTV